MPRVKELLRSERNEKLEIEAKISDESILPTEEEQKKAGEIILRISELFSNELQHNDVDALKTQIQDAITKECNAMNIPFEEQKRIEKTVIMTVLGNGPIEEYLNDPNVTEIVVQRYDNIVIEQDGKIKRVKTAFSSEEHLLTIIKRIVQKVGRQISIVNPIVDARLSDGSRINATIPPVSVDGATLTIRKFSKAFLTGDDYVRIGSLSQNMLYFLSMCVKAKISMIVSGGTGTGKTTMLNMLSSYIPEDELIITIEDTCELRLQQPNVRRMETRPATSDEMMEVNQQTLVRAALRQRPDRIILGETRDGSIVDVISAMSTGHEGSMTTIHANDPESMCSVRIPNLYSMNQEVNFTEKTIAMQVAEAVRLIVQIKRFPDGSRKVTHISEIAGLDCSGRVDVRNIFIYSDEQNGYYPTGYYPIEIIKLIHNRGYEFDDSIFGASFSSDITWKSDYYSI